jgi:hypothetical protein
VRLNFRQFITQGENPITATIDRPVFSADGLASKATKPFSGLKYSWFDKSTAQAQEMKEGTHFVIVSGGRAETRSMKSCATSGEKTGEEE